jgi:hypothetical protein
MYKKLLSEAISTWLSAVELHVLARIVHDLLVP